MKVFCSHPSKPPRSVARFSLATSLLVIAVYIAIQAVTLFLMGQPLTCTCGIVRLWTGSVSSSETSQQLADWYTFTHVIHGFAIYLILWWFAPNCSMGVRLALAVAIEAGWEIMENTPFIIDRYRQLALAHGYVGDSVINSVGDTLATILGFALARTLPEWLSVFSVVAIEMLLAYVIRDNLTLQIIQLIHPIAAITRWQAGG